MSFTSIFVSKSSVRSRLNTALKRMSPDLEAELLSRLLGVKVIWNDDHAEVIPLPHYKGQVDDLSKKLIANTRPGVKSSPVVFKWQKAKALLEKGHTKEQVRLKMKVCRERFRQILMQIQADEEAQKHDPFYGLINARARQTLENLNCNSVEEMRTLIATGRLHPDRIRNFGWKSYTDIKVWLENKGK